jgi:hypothetical protein
MRLAHGTNQLTNRYHQGVSAVLAWYPFVALTAADRAEFFSLAGAGLLVNDDQPRAATARLQAPIKLQVATMLRTVARNDMKGGIAIAAHLVSKRDAGKRQGTQ